MSVKDINIELLVEAVGFQLDRERDKAGDAAVDLKNAEARVNETEKLLDHMQQLMVRGEIAADLSPESFRRELKDLLGRYNAHIGFEYKNPEIPELPSARLVVYAHGGSALAEGRYDDLTLAATDL